MRSRQPGDGIPLPRGWTQHVKSALLHAVSLASTALTLARSRAATSHLERRRLQGELDRATTEMALLSGSESGLLGCRTASWDSFQFLDDTGGARHHLGLPDRPHEVGGGLDVPPPTLRISTHFDMGDIRVID